MVVLVEVTCGDLDKITSSPRSQLANAMSCSWLGSVFGEAFYQMHRVLPYVRDFCCLAKIEGREGRAEPRLLRRWVEGCTVRLMACPRSSNFSNFSVGFREATTNLRIPAQFLSFNALSTKPWGSFNHIPKTTSFSVFWSTFELTSISENHRKRVHPIPPEPRPTAGVECRFGL